MKDDAQFVTEKSIASISYMNCLEIWRGVSLVLERAACKKHECILLFANVKVLPGELVFIFTSTAYNCCFSLIDVGVRRIVIEVPFIS